MLDVIDTPVIDTRVLRLGDALSDIGVDHERDIDRVLDGIGSGDVVVDVTSVTFVDTAGIGLLAQLLGRACVEGRSVLLRGASWELRRLLVIAGVEPLFRYE